LCLNTLVERMNHFNSIKDLLKILYRGRKLINDMFQRRKELTYPYGDAMALLQNEEDEDIINVLLHNNIIIQNGTSLEFDSQILDFFENILEVNEEINISYINENIQQVKDNIQYYRSNTNPKYLKIIKSILQKIGKSTLRNIIDLNRNIDDTFKAESNYKIKLIKLGHNKQKLEDIQNLINQTEHLLNEEELAFYKIVADDRFREVRNQLIYDLTESRHNIIEIRKQIIEYINQIKYQSEFTEKLKKLKYLRDQFEIRPKTNIDDVLLKEKALILDAKPQYRLKLSIENLQLDKNYELIKKVRSCYNSKINPVKYSARNLTEQERKLEAEKEIYIDPRIVMNDFKRSKKHLFQFIMDYQFVREVAFGEKVTIYCQIISMFEDELELSEDFLKQGNIEYAVVYY